MIAAGKMTEAGLQKIEEAKRNGIWSQTIDCNCPISPIFLILFQT